MRRVLENPLTNAVKYGAPRTPITVEISEAEGRMQMSVHNAGPPLSPDDPARMHTAGVWALPHRLDDARDQEHRSERGTGD